MTKSHNQLTTPADAEPVNHLLQSQFAQDFREHCKAGYQALYVQTSEENRVEHVIREVAKHNGYEVLFWDNFEGFTGERANMLKDTKFINPLAALQEIKTHVFPKQTIIVMRDLDDYFKDTGLRRRLRSLCESGALVNDKRRTPLVIISPVLEIHPKLKNELTVLDFSLPNENELGLVVEFMRATLAATSKQPDAATLPEELRDKITRGLLGLTSTEAENCLSRCLVRHKAFVPDMIDTIKVEKANIIKKGETLTFIPETQVVSRDEIGGFDNLLTWLDSRRLAYSREARELGIDPPKGITLLGPPGVGKSMVAKAVCRLLGLPGYVLDVGSVFGSMVGESEQRMRMVIKQIEAQCGCVLVVDEADKAFGNAHNSSGDSGVTKRVFGTFLSWLAENKSNTFVIMTLNRTTGLPPEFLRAGRFDAMFYADLPDTATRRQILEIHFRKRGVDPAELGLADDEWDKLLQLTENFVGSELEEVVKSSRYLSFERRKSGKPNFDELYNAANAVIPMMRTDQEGMETIRDFCKNRAINVSSTPTATRRTRARRSVDVT